MSSDPGWDTCYKEYHGFLFTDTEYPDHILVLDEDDSIIICSCFQSNLPKPKYEGEEITFSSNF